MARERQKKKRGVHENITKNINDKIVLNNDNDWKRKLNEICILKNKLILNPIIDWTENDVWEFINKHNLPVNPLYKQGFKRIGCIGCPQSGSKRMIKELNERPKYKNLYFEACKKHLEYRKERNLTSYDNYETPEKYFEWWLNRK